MKKPLVTAAILLTLCAFFAAAPQAPAQWLTAQWLTDFPAAQARAKKENKPLLIEFTGSDWCPPCMMMERTVFSTAAFKAHAAKNWVLLRVDFPRKTSLPAAQQAANNKLMERYNPEETVPAFVVLSPGGQQLGRLGGFIEGGPEAFIAEVEKLAKAK